MYKLMTATEMARLTDWLIFNGFTHKETTECLKHIATGQNLPIQKKHKKRAYRVTLRK